MVAVLDGRDVGVDRRVDPGGWLVAHRWEIDRAEAVWLETLARFDADSAAAYSPVANGADSAAAYSSGESAPLDERSWPARRADAFMDMLRVALAHACEGQAAGADRYVVHVVTHADAKVATLVDGSPVDATVAARLSCDCSKVAHVVSDEGEVLYVGRKTRPCHQ
jgi:Domain of unknown function (DUF222)